MIAESICHIGRCFLFAWRNPGIFLLIFYGDVGSEDNGDVCGGVRGFSGKRYIMEKAVDGEFYAEGVLKI